MLYRFSLLPSPLKVTWSFPHTVMVNRPLSRASFDVLSGFLYKSYTNLYCTLRGRIFGAFFFEPRGYLKETLGVVCGYRGVTATSVSISFFAWVRVFFKKRSILFFFKRGCHFDINIPSFVLWFKPNLLVQQVQLLKKEGGGLGVKPAVAEVGLQTSPLFFFSSTFLAAALGYTRRQRRLLFIQHCLFKHIRRTLIVLSVRELEVWLLGIMPRFNIFWKTLVRPTMDFFLHPQTNLPLFDLGIAKFRFARCRTAAEALASVYPTITNVDVVSDTFFEEAWASFKEKMPRGLNRAFLRKTTWCRFKFQCSSLFVWSGVAFGQQKTKKIRSIKKRRAKKLVRQSGFRFWPR